MDSARPPLMLVSPLPPARNGIADYAAALLGGLAPHYDCAVACEDWLAEAPAGIPVVDPALAHRLVAPGGRVLHQLGNNPDHGFVLRALRQTPGVATLHDPGLLHLHESTGESRPAILAGMRHAAPGLAATYARQIARPPGSRPGPTTCCSIWPARCWRGRGPWWCIPASRCAGCG